MGLDFHSRLDAASCTRSMVFDPKVGGCKFMCMDTCMYVFTQFFFETGLFGVFGCPGNCSVDHGSLRLKEFYLFLLPEC